MFTTALVHHCLFLRSLAVPNKWGTRQPFENWWFSTWNSQWFDVFVWFEGLVILGFPLDMKMDIMILIWWCINEIHSCLMLFWYGTQLNDGKALLLDEDRVNGWGSNDGGWSWRCAVCESPGSFWDDSMIVRWIGLRENLNRKPSIFPLRTWGLPVNFRKNFCSAPWF